MTNKTQKNKTQNKLISLQNPDTSVKYRLGKNITGDYHEITFLGNEKNIALGPSKALGGSKTPPNEKEKENEKESENEKEKEPEPETLIDKYLYEGSRQDSIVGEGAFGSVHKTKSPGGTKYAAKILKIGKEINKIIINQKYEQTIKKQILEDAKKRNIKSSDPRIIDATKRKLQAIKENLTQQKLEVFNNEVDILKKLKPNCSEYILCYIGVFKKEHPLEYYIITEGLFEHVSLDSYVKTDKKYRDGINKSLEFFKNALKHKEIVDKDSVAEAGKQLHKKDDNYNTTESLLSMPYIELASNLCNGLHVLHKMGISHRDIKPENIMINPTTRQIKYIDFGLACDESTNLDMVCKYPIIGTPDTRDPYLLKVKNEVTDKNILYKSDLWSLGTVLFFSLSLGKYPIDYVENIDESIHKGLLKISDLYKHIVHNYNVPEFWSYSKILIIFELNKQHHELAMELNKQNGNNYSSALLSELLTLTPTDRKMHITHKNSIEFIKTSDKPNTPPFTKAKEIETHKEIINKVSKTKRGHKKTTHRIKASNLSTIREE